MSAQFDPYFEWFDIAIEEHPINYYRLLGLNQFESKRETISAALEHQIELVLTFLDGEHTDEAKKVLDELRIAGRVLLNDAEREKYNNGLCAKHISNPKPVLSPNTRLQPVSKPNIKLESTSKEKGDSKPPLPLLTSKPLGLTKQPQESSTPTPTSHKQDLPKPPLMTKLPPGTPTPTSHKQDLPKPPLMTKLPPGTPTPTSHKQDLPKPPLMTELPPGTPTPTSYKQDLPKPPLMTKLPPGSETSASPVQNSPTSPQMAELPPVYQPVYQLVYLPVQIPVQQPAQLQAQVPVQTVIQPSVQPSPVNVPVPEQVPASGADLDFSDIPPSDPTMNFAAIDANNRRKILTLGLVCGILLVWVFVLAYTQISRIEKTPLPVAQTTPQEVNWEEETEESVEEEEEEEYSDSLEISSESQPVDSTNKIVPKIAPQLKVQVAEEPEEHASIVNERKDAESAENKVREPEQVQEQEEETSTDFESVYMKNQRSGGVRKKRTPKNIVFEESPWEAGTLYILNIEGITYSLHWCPAGTFYSTSSGLIDRGTSDSDEEDEDFFRQVVITKGFWILETEVTQEMWKSIMGNNPSTFRQGGTVNNIQIQTNTDKFPVENVSWDECYEFCERLAKKTHLKVQLPTEAQWELACRAGSDTPFSTGDNLNDSQANFGLNHLGPIRCGSFQSNAWGIYDMHGNVAEWCADWFAENLDGKDFVKDPTGPEDGTKRSYRGGNWNLSDSYCSSNTRFQESPDIHSSEIGFRFIITDLEPEAQNLVQGNSSQKAKKQMSVSRKQTKVRQPGVLRTVEMNGIKYHFRWCPPGEFMMGDSERNIDISHRVVLTRGFWILETEVTQEMWISIMGKNPSAFSPGGSEAGMIPNMDTSQFPVDSVLWTQCQEFCSKISREMGMTAKLPTEAQWEYACRAGTTTPFNTGTDLTQEQANFKNYDTINPLDRTCKCGSYPPNAWGIYDMHGNVEEWCEDWYKQGYYHVSPVEDPQGPDAGRARVIRGGCWANPASSCRSSYRNHSQANSCANGGGFRFILMDDLPEYVVQEAEEPEELEESEEEVEEKTSVAHRKKMDTNTKTKSKSEKSQKSEKATKDVPQIKPNVKFKRKKNKIGEQVIQKIDGIEYRLRWCPPGTFMMGEGIDGQVQTGPNSFLIGPSPLDDLHPITLTKGFWILETEVTQEMWLNVMGRNPSAFSPTGHESEKVRGKNTTQFPVESVSWEECQEFCTILSQKLGLTVKLPTEAQWEYACRAGTNTPYNTGTKITVQLANINNFNVVAPLERPVPSGSYPPNAWGIYDMHGNVAEWCQDQYLQGYYKISPKVDPPGPENGKGHIYRGGGWSSNCRSGERNYGNFCSSAIGFRFIIIQE